MNNRYILPVFLILLTLPIPYGKASTASEHDGARLIALSTWIAFYIAERDGALPESWDELFSIPDLATISRVPLKRDNFTERFSFIRSEDQPKYPDGDLILIQSVPYSEYVDFMGVRVPTGSSRRMFIYRDERGRVLVEGDTEENLQRMLIETGIKIPPPEPYQVPPLPRPEPPDIPSEPHQQSKPRQMEPAEEQPAPADVDAGIAAEPPSEEPQELTPIDESKAGGNRSLLWLLATVLGLMVLLLGWRMIKRSSPAK